MDRPRDRVLRIAALDAEAGQKLALLATEQHGVAARTQLLALGFTRNEIQKRIDEARLHRIHRGVYAVGHRKLTLKGIWMAAVLAVGADALTARAARPSERRSPRSTDRRRGCNQRSRKASGS